MGMQGTIPFSEGRVAGAARVEAFEVRRTPAVYETGPQLNVQVNLYATAVGMAGDLGLVWQHPLQGVVPLSALDPSKPFESLEKWIIENVEMFSAATYSDGGGSLNLEAARIERIQALNWAYCQAIGALVEGYPKVEQASWPQQVEEARDLLSDANTPTPWLSACAAARGITREDLAERVLALNTPYRMAHGTLTGIRQLAEAQIDAATTPEEVSAVAWNFGPNPLAPPPAA